MAGVSNKVEALSAAWQNWRDEDFTWEGLKKKTWLGWVVCGDGLVREKTSGAIYGQSLPTAAAPEQGRKANLQDFWRADPATGCWRDDAAMLSSDELIIAAGQPTYHRVHLPLAYADGTPTEKAQWAEDALDALAHARLIAAGKTVWDEGEIVGPDRRARFDGGVWPSFYVHRLMLLPDQEILGAFWPTDCSEKPFISACFYFSLFTGDALFDGAAFHGRASFDSAQFHGMAAFGRAVFCGEAIFKNVQCHRKASFDGANFLGEAGFENARFNSDARFDKAQFNANSAFDNALFLGPTVFEGVTFEHQTDFDKAKFHDRATFINVKFRCQAWFFKTQFEASAAFDWVIFSNLASFRGSRFAQEASFGKASFLEVDFANGLFQGPAYFDEAMFQNAMKFNNAVFDQLASFEGITWPEAAWQWHAAFDQVLFRGTLNISKSGFRSFAAFDGATLERGIQIDEQDEADAKDKFLVEREAAIKAARADGKAFEIRENQKRRDRFGERAKHVTLEEIEVHVKSQREARLKQLERGCRVLKLAMEKASNKSREQMLFRFELLARRAQRGLPWGEALFSDLYGAASDYGASMVRPLGGLLLLIVAFVLIYWGWGELQPDTKAPGFWDALRFSVGRVAPFGPWGEGEAWLTFMDNRASYVGVCVRLIATFQTGVAIVLAFLFALAVRRRFQLS